MSLIAMSVSLSPLLSLMAIASLLVIVVLALFRLRLRLGLAPLYVTIGVFQHMQVMLANTLYMEVFPGMMMSPGSVVMFPAMFFAVLLVYISDDAGEARKLSYGLVVSNLAMGAVSFFFAGMASDGGATLLFNLPPDFFSHDFRIMVVGTVTLALDIALLIFAFEQSYKFFPKNLFLRITTAVVAVLVFDNIVFVTGSFHDHPEFTSIFVSGFVGKTIFALFYSVALYLYFKLFEPKTDESLASVDGTGDWQDVFHFLTFRQKYSVLKELNSELRESRDKLEKALAEVKSLQGLLPICSFCHDIRDDAGEWHKIDEYVSTNSDTKFSHGICPGCADTKYPGVIEDGGRVAPTGS